MKTFNTLILLCFTLLLTSCFEDKDDIPISTSEINDFVWKGMNLSYLYKENVQQLSNEQFGINAIENRYGTNDAYNAYLNSFDTPRELFESLKYDPETTDRFSWIVDNYFELERGFSGISKTNGMEFSLFRAPNSDTDLIGIVRLVLPDSNADLNGIKRGDLFYAINNTNINDDNFNTLLNQDIYTINLGNYNNNNTPDDRTDDTIEITSQNIELTKLEYTENPVFKTEIYNLNSNTIGYLMYNGFNVGSENELNNAFGEFKSNNVQHLVLDLRYNSGGSVSVETALASMISGQFSGDVFKKLIYNNTLQENNRIFPFIQSIGNTSINSLNLDKLYVLTTRRTASASEGLINSLKSYINVVQIGANTRGKTQASITIYDSPDFRRDGANRRHTYAMQPLVANGVNKNDIPVPSNGLTPDIELAESALNYGVLGDINEPLLAAAIADINGTTSKTSKFKSQKRLELVKDFDLNPKKGGMIID